MVRCVRHKFGAEILCCFYRAATKSVDPEQVLQTEIFYTRWVRKKGRMKRFWIFANSSWKIFKELNILPVADLRVMNTRLQFWELGWRWQRGALISLNALTMINSFPCKTSGPVLLPEQSSLGVLQLAAQFSGSFRIWTLQFIMLASETQRASGRWKIFAGYSLEVYIYMYIYI